METSLGITVEAVNDAPILSVASVILSIDEDSGLLLHGLRLIDVDVRQGAGVATLSVSRGTVSLLPGSAAAVVGASICAEVNGSRVLECSGDFAALDQARVPRVTVW